MIEGAFTAAVLRRLASEGARFVVVGGVAVNLQGVPRFTADLDLAIAVERDTLERVGRVMREMGLSPRLPVPASQLEDPATVRDWIDNRDMKAFTFQDPRDPVRQVDLLLDPGMPFEEIETAAEPVRAFGVVVPVASIDVLVRMKEVTGRPQDIADVEALRRVKELRERDG